MTPSVVHVRAPARLHLGFVDLHGGLGRRFGSIGLAITGLDTEVVAQRAAPGVFEVLGLEPERAQKAAQTTLAWLQESGGLRLEVSAVAPGHAGLGSGTQLGLAVACAVTTAYAREVSARCLAPIVGRGVRSGIGVAVFEGGGMLVDGGRGLDGPLAPVLSRLDFPPAWRVVLIFDGAHQGLHGTAERTAFASLPPMPEGDAAALARWCLVGLLPALAERDFAGFSTAVAEIQARIGAYFAPAQGGTAYTSARVATAVAAIRAEFNLPGVGQSSWGPTAFIFAPSAAVADEIRRFGEARQTHGSSLRFQTVTGCNHGAIIESRIGS